MAAICGLLFLASATHAQIPGDSVVLEGNYLQIGISDNGTLGVGDRTSPGILFDGTGSGNFEDSLDYLTPGFPFEGFSVRHADSGGVIANNNNGETLGFGPASAPLLINDAGVTGYDHQATWSGTISGVMSIQHVYSLNDNSQQLEVTTTILALTDLNDLRFGRFIDPDSGGASSIQTRGNTTLGIPPEDLINSESETNGATLSLYSDSDFTHNTAAVDIGFNGFTPPWSDDPDVYLAGSGDTVGDDSIGIGWEIGDLLSGELVMISYVYAVGLTIDDFSFGGGTNFASRVSTPNQLALATFIDANSLNPTAELEDLLDELTLLTDEELGRALDELSGAIYGTSATAGVQSTTLYLSQLASILRNRGYAQASYGGGGSSPALAANYSMQDGELVIRGQNSRCDCLTGWVSGYGAGGSAASDGNAAGFTYGWGGTMFGIEKPISRYWSAGLWGNLAWSNLSSRSFQETAEVENYHFGTYLYGNNGCNYWIGLLGGGYNEGNVQRIIGTVTPTGNYSGGQANAYLEHGRSYCLAGWETTPFLAGQYIYMHQGSFTETGGGATNLTVADFDTHSLRSILGGRVRRSFTTRRCWVVQPEVHASWVHEYLDTDQIINTSIAGGTGGGIAVAGLDLGRDWFAGGAAVQVRLSECTRIYGGYDIQANANQVLHFGSGGAEWVW